MQDKCSQLPLPVSAKQEREASPRRRTSEALGLNSASEQQTGRFAHAAIKVVFILYQHAADQLPALQTLLRVLSVSLRSTRNHLQMFVEDTKWVFFTKTSRSAGAPAAGWATPTDQGGNGGGGHAPPVPVGFLNTTL